MIKITAWIKIKSKNNRKGWYESVQPVTLPRWPLSYTSLDKITSVSSSTSSKLKNSKTQPNKRVGIAVAVLYLNQEVAPIHSSFPQYRLLGSTKFKNTP